MKILYICWLDTATTDLPLFMAKAWENEGHEVLLFPHDIEFSNRAYSRLTDAIALWSGNQGLYFNTIEKKLNTACRTFRPDVVLFGHPFIAPEGMERLKKQHGCLIGYFLGYNNLLERNVVPCIRAADFLIAHDSYAIPLLQGSRYGRVPHVFFLLCMANPQEHRPVALSAEDRRDYGGDVAFIGGMGPNRVEALRSLACHDLRIWGGRDWKKIDELSSFARDEPVYGHKKTKIYNAAKIVLNIEDDEKQVNAISNRVPEVLACGGFVITEWRKDLEKTALVDGESIVIYRSTADLREKVHYYLQHPEERKRISENGRQIVLNSLTYQHVTGPLVRQIEMLVGEKRGVKG